MFVFSRFRGPIIATRFRAAKAPATRFCQTVVASVRPQPRGGTVFEPVFWPPKFSTAVWFWRRHEARVLWKMYNHYAQEARSKGMDLLRVNLDETCVCVVQKPLRGVVMKTGRRVRGAVPSRLQVSRTMQRTNITYVAMISDDHSFTAELPQFIIGDARSFPVARFDAFRHQAPARVYLLRGGKAWCNHRFMIKIIRVLGLICRARRPNALVVMCLDTVSSHINNEVLATFHEENIRPLFIPAKTTSLLQPLDVYVFRLFKELLRRRFHDLHAAAAGPIQVGTLLQALYDCIASTIVGRPWLHIFSKVGLSEGQFQVARFLEDHLIWPSHLVCPLDDTPLSDGDVAAVMPANRRIPLANLLPPPAEAVMAVEDAPAVPPPHV